MEAAIGHVQVLIGTWWLLRSAPAPQDLQQRPQREQQAVAAEQALRDAMASISGTYGDRGADLLHSVPSMDWPAAKSAAYARVLAAAAAVRAPPQPAR